MKSFVVEVYSDNDITEQAIFIELSGRFGNMIASVKELDVQKTLAPDACPYCLGSGKGKMSGIEVGCMFCSDTGKIK